MQILTSSSSSRKLVTGSRPQLNAPLPAEVRGDSVTLGVLVPKPSPRMPVQKSSKWKTALIGASVGALAGAVGGAIGGSVGSVAVAPVVAFMGGAAAASTFKFRTDKNGTKANSEARSLFTRVAAAGLAGAAVVALGAHGGWVGATAAGIGGLVTGGALGYGLGS